MGKAKKMEKVATDDLFGVLATLASAHEPEAIEAAQKRLKEWGLTPKQAAEELERRRAPSDDVKLTSHQAEFAIRCVEQYFLIKEKIGQKLLPSRLMVDMSHSALLRRLLSGKEPLEKPPPKRFSYPCYELGEGEPVEICYMSECPVYDEKGEQVEKPDEELFLVVIDQDRAWRWVDKEAGILLHRNGDKFKFTPYEKPKDMAIGVLQKMEA